MPNPYHQSSQTTITNSNFTNNARAQNHHHTNQTQPTTKSPPPHGALPPITHGCHRSLLGLLFTPKPIGNPNPCPAVLLCLLTRHHCTTPHHAVHGRPPPDRTISITAPSPARISVAGPSAMFRRRLPSAVSSALPGIAALCLLRARAAPIIFSRQRHRSISPAASIAAIDHNQHQLRLCAPVSNHLELITAASLLRRPHLTGSLSLALMERNEKEERMKEDEEK